MPPSDGPYLRLAIGRLTVANPNHYAIWVLQAPYPGGYVHHDCLWTEELHQLWNAWQDVFSLRGLPAVPHIPSAYVPQFIWDDASETTPGGNQPNGQSSSYTSRLMQRLGVSLWQWLFDGPIQSSLDQSQGIAIGQNKPLRLRIDVRDPDLIAIPWEIVQSQPGKQAISLSQQILFSRTTSDVDPLPPLDTDLGLRILLVLGHDGTSTPSDNSHRLRLEQEAATLKQVLEEGTQTRHGMRSPLSVPCQVDTLLQPSPAELIQRIETGRYNILFYAGHGVPAPDGGLLFLQPEATLNGTELAQVLTRCRIKLAVFNACWGAQPDHAQQQAIPRSSLAEVLIHHGVPAVLGMRDSIADHEALSFIQVFAEALAERLPVDQAVAIARQHLLTLYKFNQPAWTLPVLYMHPEFNGQIVVSLPEDRTELPGDSPTSIGQTRMRAAMRAVGDQQRVWPVRGGMMRVGRRPENDLVIAEQWVSQRHAEIFCRNSLPGQGNDVTYFLRDFSRFGTLLREPHQHWQKIHRQEVVLQPGSQLKFGSSQGQLLEFVVEGSFPSSLS